MPQSDKVTFKDKYNELNNTWQDKALLISLYHTIMKSKYPSWNINDTAEHFGVSLGLVSENIRLAHEIDCNNEQVKNAKNREDALELIDRRKYKRNRKDFVLIRQLGKS